MTITKFFLAISLLCVLVVTHPPVLHADSLETVAVYTAGLGALYGLGDALMHDRDPIKGCWDGLMAGSVAPGAVVGAGIGLGIGAVLNGLEWTPATEKAWVGWGAAGWTIGSLLSVQSVATGLDQRLGAVLPVFSLGLWGYYGMGVVEGLSLSRKATTQISGDAARHHWVSRKLRDRFDPGLALAIGAGKEADDYFFSRGTPEFRDIQNDWEGVFGGGRRY